MSDLIGRAVTDTAEYINFRLERVGSKTSPFAGDAVALLHEATGGQLRDVDRIATACLRVASAQKVKRVDREILQDVVDRDTNLP